MGLKLVGTAWEKAGMITLDGVLLDSSVDRYYKKGQISGLDRE